MTKNKCNANETAACCCVDVGTIIDNDDCVSTYNGDFATEAQAKEKLAALTAEAQKIASEACVIDSEIAQNGADFHLTAQFTFCCGAENLIFQLKLR